MPAWCVSVGDPRFRLIFLYELVMLMLICVLQLYVPFVSLLELTSLVAFITYRFNSRRPGVELGIATGRTWMVGSCY